MSHLSEATLNEYLDQVLDHTTSRAIEAHLDTCPDCRAQLNDLQLVFQYLDQLVEKPMPHDLAPGILASLPEPALPVGWKLALALQAGLAMGLLGAITWALWSLIRSQIDTRLLVSAWPDLLGGISVHIPISDFNLPDLSGYSLPFSAPVTVALLITVVILLGLGNARLLWNGHEVQR